MSVKSLQLSKCTFTIIDKGELLFCHVMIRLRLGFWVEFAVQEGVYGCRVARLQHVMHV